MIETQPTQQQKKVFFSTIAKLEKSQKLKAQLIPYLQEHYPHLVENKFRKQSISECCNHISFRRYLETGNIQLQSANFCKYDRVCIACATKRAMRMIKKFSQGIKEYNLYEKKWYYIVLTISHSKSDTLESLMDRLMFYKERLARAYRNGKRGSQKSKSFFSQFDGMVISIEVSHKGNNGRHPHINILACSSEEINVEQRKYVRGSTNAQLLEEWMEMTDQTSYIHNIRKIEVSKDHFTRSGIGEVFKYAIKFSDLKLTELAEVMHLQHKYRYRFFATYGIFRGWKLEIKTVDKSDWSEGIFYYVQEDNQYRKVI